MNNSEYIKEISVKGNLYKFFDINKAANDIGLNLNNIPYSLRILFENVLRLNPKKQYLLIFKNWLENKTSQSEIPFMPARILMQDFTGVPAIVDLAAMRDAIQKLGGDPLQINPVIPVDLVIDHSVQVDYYGNKDSFAKNVKKEIDRNRERYEFLKWGQKAFNNFRVVPPGTGICHQVNLEYLAKVVWSRKQDGARIAYPDSLVGTDSHTTMINGLSVLGWGVGGIEAEAAMLGQPLLMILPDVVGVRLKGVLDKKITATDLVLTITQMLRKKNVVGKFVEFFGSGIESLTLEDRATISNMAPEYGATCGFFPTDSQTIKYLAATSRDEELIELVEQYTKTQSLWHDPKIQAEYTEIVELDLTSLESSLAGPRRPQDRVSLSEIANNFNQELPSFAKGAVDTSKKYNVTGKDFAISHGDVMIAAITSCTNTSNPSVMIGAALLAKKALELGLTKKPWVKTSLAPGSKIVTEYLKESGLDVYLNHLGFDLVGYGCTTCIGNSGPLMPEIEDAIAKNDIVAVSVLSGNRNFEGRIHPLTRANYLASPPLVVAYAIAGSVNINLALDPIGKSSSGDDVYLKDIWPSHSEISSLIEKYLNPKMFKDKYSDVFLGDQEWQNLKLVESDTYHWDKNSTYINNPPYFDGIENKSAHLHDIKSARILALLADSVTTDHISPAGSIAKSSPAGKYLLDLGIESSDFNSYGSRRGNHEVMMRGTFANIRIKNLMCNGVEGGVTINQLNNTQMSIYDAAMDYKANNIPLVIFAGKEYGSGSSRDWAAKGTILLGVKAVIAESFERIHRSNLVGMGVLPLTLMSSTVSSLQLAGSEYITIEPLGDNISPHQVLKCIIKRANGKVDTINLKLEIYTDKEIEYIKQGGIMQLVVKNLRGLV